MDKGFKNLLIFLAILTALYLTAMTILGVTGKV